VRPLRPHDPPHRVELGVIAPGALGDLLIVDGDPLENLYLLEEQGKHLALIMKGGQLFVNRLG